MKKGLLLLISAAAAVLFASGCKQEVYSPTAADSSGSFAAQQFIVLDSTDLHLHIGEAASLNAKISPASSQKIGYVSSDPKVASVDSTGVVYAVSGGSATIQASTSDGKTTAKCKVTVIGIEKMNLTSSVPLTAADGDSFTVKISFENCTYPSVKVVADCGGGSIQAANSSIRFGSELSQNQVSGSATVTFRFTGSKPVNSLRIIGFDSGRMIDVKEYTLTKSLS